MITASVKTSRQPEQPSILDDSLDLEHLALELLIGGNLVPFVCGDKDARLQLLGL